MRLKYYLRGLGLGILVTTIILMISFSGRKNEISDEEIKERAEQLGMVMQEDETTPNATETEVAPSENQTPQDSEQNSPTEQTPSEQTSVTFTIEKGDSSLAVAEKLYDKGLINDAAAFNDYLVEQSHDSRIMIGTLQIPMGADYETLAKIITGIVTDGQ